MKKKLKLLFFSAFFLSFLSGTSYGAIIRINTPKIELELAPGQTSSGEIEVENPTDQEMKLRIYLEDWHYKAIGSGEKDFGPAGSFPFSGSSWITFSPSSAVVPPFGKVTERYTIKAPSDAKGSYYSVLFFENILGHVVDEQGASLQVAGRIGSLFFIRVKGTVERSGEVESLVLIPPAGNSPLEIAADFKNTGNVDITLEGNYVLMDASGAIVARGALEKIYTQPGGEAKRTTKWVGRLAPGKYDAIITFDLGDGKNVVQEKELIVS